MLYRQENSKRVYWLSKLCFLLNLHLIIYKKLYSKFIKLRFLSASIFPIYTFLFLFVSLLFLFLCLLFFCYCVFTIPYLLFLLLLCLYLTLSLFFCPFLFNLYISLVSLVISKNLLYICCRECISNDISNDYGAAKKL